VNLLLDTNVLSEVHRPAPDLKVLGWLDAVDEDLVFISVASIAELRRGIALIDDGRRRVTLEAWLANDLPARFAEQIPPIDHAVAGHWGVLMAQGRRSGVALSIMDGFFAATTRAKGLTLVTRNVKDFTSFGVPLFNPWDE
jgi:predicted nucleic acid-binding protein